MHEAAAGPAEIPGSSGVERIFAAAGALGMIGGAAAVWYFDPTKAGLFPVCPLYSLTGFACPGCGLTRGFHALFHGDLIAALDYNALLPLFAGLLGLGLVSLVYLAVKGKKFPITLLPPNGLWISLVVLLAFGVIR